MRCLLSQVLSRCADSVAWTSEHVPIRYQDAIVWRIIAWQPAVQAGHVSVARATDCICGGWQHPLSHELLGSRSLVGAKPVTGRVESSWIDFDQQILAPLSPGRLVSDVTAVCRQAPSPAGAEYLTACWAALGLHLADQHGDDAVNLRLARLRAGNSDLRFAAVVPEPVFRSQREAAQLLLIGSEGKRTTPGWIACVAGQVTLPAQLPEGAATRWAAAAAALDPDLDTDLARRLARAKARRRVRNAYAAARLAEDLQPDPLGASPGHQAA
jgi:hypothetical protein